MADYYMDANGRIVKKKKKSEYVMNADGSITKRKDETVTSDQGEESKWYEEVFQAPTAFDDGYQFGDVLKTVGSTVGDAALGAVQGAGGMLEGVADFLGYGVAEIYDKMGNKIKARGIRSRAEEDTIRNILKGADDFFEDYSVLGNTSDSVMEGLGQVGAIILTGGIAGAAGASAGAASAITTGLMGASSMGSGIGEAYRSGATDGEAWTYGAIKGVVDAGSELIFGGLGKTVKALGISKGLSSLDDMLAKKLSNKISNTFFKNLTQFGVKSAAEGVEEVLAGIGSAVGKKLTYMSDEELSEIIKDENLMEQFVVGAVTSGISQSGIVPGMKAGSLIETTQSGKDFITGLNKNETAVVDKWYESKISEAEKEGKKLTNAQKNKLYEEAISDMDNGRISIDTIEEVLGGDTYKSYRETVDSEESLKKELDELRKMKNGDRNDIQNDRLAELKAMDFSDTSKRDGLKNRLSQEVSELVKDSRLSESYNERSRRGQAFTADFSQYDEKQQTVVKRAVESGILNNTRTAHEFVDMVAKLSGDKGISFDFIDNAKLKESGLALEGKTVNGFVKDGNIAINIQSAKALNSVVGHEITHVLEGTEFYVELQQAVKAYATAKGEYDTRLQALTKLYEGVEGADVNTEVMADLIGDYLFTDSDFVNSLSTEQRNIFQKIFDEIKYLLKAATAGSKEARELEKVKRAFEKAYRENENQSAENAKLRYDVSEDKALYQYIQDSLSGKVSKKSYHKLSDSISDRLASDIEKIVGFSVTGYGNEISPGSIEHINNDHGTNGKSDQSMSDLHDLAKINYVIENYDNIREGKESKEYKNGDGSYAKTIELQKKIDDKFYYVVEAVPDAKLKTLHVVSAYINKNDTFLGVAVSKDPSRYVQDELQSNVSFDERLPVNGGQTEVDSAAASGNLSNNSISQNTENAIEFSKSDQGLAPTQSQQFKKWFGDWQNQPENASKVVNADGTPRIVYHGTSAQFNTFRSASGEYWFSEYEDYAEAMMEERGGGEIKAVYLNMRNPYRAKLAPGQFSDPNYEAQILRNAKATGHDGVIIENDTTDPLVAETFYVVFSPEQVKSATDNIGTFDKDNPDIRYSLSGNGDIAPIPRGIYGKDIALEAPIRSDVAPAQPTADMEVREDANPEIEETLEGWLGDEPEKPIATVKQHLETKLDNLNTELSNNQRFRAESADSLDEKIAKLQSEYDAKKNKDTKYANNLLRRIESLKRRKADVDADYAKRISDIESRIQKTTEKISEDHTRADHLEAVYKRIDKELEWDKAELTEQFKQRREKLEKQLTDQNTFVSENAKALYVELTHLKKGIRASEQLGYLLDQGYDWHSIKTALLDVKNWPDTVRNSGSAVESAVRELLQDEYENSWYELDNLDSEIERKTAKLEAEAERKKKDARTANQRKVKQGEYAKWAADAIGDTTTWKDKSLGIQYATNTLRRNLRDIIRDADGNRDIAKADAIYDELQGKYNANEAQLNRETNQIKKAYADMKITRAEDQYIQMLGELRHNPDTTLTETVVMEFYEKNKDHIDEAKVDKAIAMARKTYDSLLERLNKVLSEQGMKEIPYREGYFPHFTEDKQGIFAKILNWKAKKNDIPTDIAGMTEQFKPNRSWQSFNKHRYGDTTDYSFTKGLDTYVQGALDWIYHIEDIQKRRAFENHIRYVHSEEGIQDQIDEVFASNEYDADQAQERIDGILAQAENPLGNFVADFRTATNLLAGKKHSMDRGMEQMTSRKAYSVMTNISNRVSANMVAGSISSAITNFIPITQSWGEVSPKYSLIAMADTIRSTMNDDGMVDKSDFLTNRLRTAENLYKSGWDKASEKVGFLMEVVDGFTSQTVWRSKYRQNLSESMSESEAIKNADQFAENVMAGRSRGNQPTIFEAKNPIIRMLTSFQLEVNNQYGYMLKDMPQEMRDKTIGKLVKGYATMFIGAYVYNALSSKLTGRDSAFDPIGIMEELFRDLFGGDDEEEDPAGAILNLTENVLDEVPFVGGLLGGGRIPISSALPYDGNISDIIEGIGKFAEKDYSDVTTEWLNPIYYLVFPMAGGQVRKTNQGLAMFSDDNPISGSYTPSGNLRFPVEDTFGNRLKAGIFGQWANQNAQDYLDEGRSPLKEKQIQELIDVGMSIQDYWEYRDDLKGLKTLAQKADYIDSLDLTTGQKNVLINNIADREEDIDMTDYSDYDSFEEFDFAIKNPEKYDFFMDNGISYQDYASADETGKNAYTWAYKNPEKYEMSKVITGDVVEYKHYTSVLSKIEADKDADGKAISGSRKGKVVEYINGLKMDYGQKIILLKSTYPSDDTYNMDIINYLNERKDISYKQMEMILKELGFTVKADGTITWEE